MIASPIQDIVAMQTAAEVPRVPTGQLRSFGLLGPIYEVGRAVYRLEDGDWMVEITIVETGETAEYRLTHLNDDPAAI